MPKESKATKAEINKRINIVKDMIFNGFTRREMLQNIAKNAATNWNVNERSIDGYIATAQAEIAESFLSEKEQLADYIKVRYLGIYRKLMLMKDYKGAILPLDKLAELAGLKVHRADVKQQIEVIFTDETELSDERADALLSETLLTE